MTFTSLLIHFLISIKHRVSCFSPTEAGKSPPDPDTDTDRIAVAEQKINTPQIIDQQVFLNAKYLLDSTDKV